MADGWKALIGCGGCGSCIMRRIGSLLLVWALAAPLGAADDGGQSGARQETPAQRGYRLLTTKAYLPADFDQEVFDDLWKTWEEPLRSEAQRAGAAERRRMAFARYGLAEAPGREGGVALQYVDDGEGGWVMNCLACHGGKVAGRVIPGLPNTHYALETLTEEVRATKLRLAKPLAHMDVALAAMPLGTSNGTTNAVAFGVLLLAYRDAELNVHRDRVPPQLVHHDQDAPPWWNIRKKSHLYADGSVAKGHRALMQFLLLPANGPEKFHQWDQDYADILAWIESLEPPPYPFAIDRPLAERGEKVFNRSCADCHGTYGERETYPQKIVPIEVVGTDRVRLDAVTTEGRARYQSTWFNHYGELPGVTDPGGYVAPPLDGIWASAPYLHNGSVPTLWHLFHPKSRPTVWLRAADGYDEEKVGLEFTAYDELPAEARTGAQRRRYFDTRQFSKSAPGHLFPAALERSDRRAVLEYLKTL